MKKLNYIIIALALGICSAGAITITVHEDKKNSFDFTMAWYQGDAFNHGAYYEGTYNQVYIDWEIYSGSPSFEAGYDGYWAYVQSDIYIMSDFIPPQMFGTDARGRVEMVFDPYPNQLQTFKLTNWSEYFSVTVADDLQSARWTSLKAKSVPDAGSTLALLGMGIAVVGFARRFRSSREE